MLTLKYSAKIGNSSRLQGIGIDAEYDILYIDTFRAWVGFDKTWM